MRAYAPFTPSIKEYVYDGANTIANESAELKIQYACVIIDEVLQHSVRIAHSHSFTDPQTVQVDRCAHVSTPPARMAHLFLRCFTSQSGATYSNRPLACQVLGLKFQLLPVGPTHYTLLRIGGKIYVSNENHALVTFEHPPISPGDRAHFYYVLAGLYAKIKNLQRTSMTDQ